LSLEEPTRQQGCSEFYAEDKVYLIGSSVKSPSDIKISIVGPSVRPSVGSLATSIPITGATGLSKKNRDKD
jgi:hypothetical protein